MNDQAKPDIKPKNVTKPMDVFEFFELSRRLETRHAVFYQLWEMGEPLFTNEIPTAAVRLNAENDALEFMINPVFWKTLSNEQKDFILCHEALHVLFKHGIRGSALKNTAEIANVAMDIVINELLREAYRFDRKVIDPKNEFCWLDKFFKPDEPVCNQTFEFYYNRLLKKARVIAIMIGKGDAKTVDDHRWLDGIKLPDRIKRALGENLSDNEREQIQDQSEEATGKAAGTDPANNIFTVPNSVVPPLKAWEIAVKRLSAKLGGNEFDTFEHWARVNRRLVAIPDAALLPTEMEFEDRDQKASVFIFIDVSGSITEALRDRFWIAYRSIPTRRFDIKLFSFDTDVHELDPKSKHLIGGGGTAFGPLEDYIHRGLQKKEFKYPDVVFVLTDGHGTHISPRYPERWHWFIDNAGSTNLVPKKSHHHKFEDFERKGQN